MGRAKRVPSSPLADALERVGDRWTLLVVAALLEGPKRFNELQEELEGIAPNVLSARLKALVEQALAVPQPYSERPPRFAYELSESGRELAGALRLVRGHAEWAPPVVTCSGLTGTGVDDVWQRIASHREHLGADGLAHKRAAQQLDFTWALVRDELDQRLRSSAGVAPRGRVPAIGRMVTLPPRTRTRISGLEQTI